MALVDVVSFTGGLVAEADTVAAAATAAAAKPPAPPPPPLLPLVLVLVKFVVLGLAGGADGRELLAPAGLTSIFFMEVAGDDADEDKPAFLLLDELALNDENIPVQTMLVIIFTGILSLYV